MADRQNREATMVTRFLPYPASAKLVDIDDTIARQGGSLNNHPDVLAARAQIRLAQRAMLQLVQELAEEDVDDGE